MRRGGACAVIAGGVLVAAAAVMPGCKRDAAAVKPATASAPTVPVSVATAEVRDVPIEVRTIGTVESLAQVVLKPQISGQLDQIRFEEGKDVQAGDVLLVLDKRPFEAALREAEANLNKNRALAEDARRAADQMAQAAAGRAVSEREKEQFEAAAAAADAQVKAGEAAVETARLQLEFCTITAPISGKTGLTMVKKGSVVKANETELVAINQITPIGVGFAVPERMLPAIRKMSAERTNGLPVDVSIPGDEERPPRGVLAFLDNKVDVSTGTIRLRGVFGNGDRRLWPGQFVNVVLTIDQAKGVVVVPAKTVQTGQKGQHVFVVKDDKTVEMRPVKVGETIDNVTVITEGVKGGETVVTDGQLRLMTGFKVDVKSGPGVAQANPGAGSASGSGE